MKPKTNIFPQSQTNISNPKVRQKA